MQRDCHYNYIGHQLARADRSFVSDDAIAWAVNISKVTIQVFLDAPRWLYGRRRDIAADTARRGASIRMNASYASKRPITCANPRIRNKYQTQRRIGVVQNFSGERETRPRACLKIERQFKIYNKYVLCSTRERASDRMKGIPNWEIFCGAKSIVMKLDTDVGKKKSNRIEWLNGHRQ